MWRGLTLLLIIGGAVLVLIGVVAEFDILGLGTRWRNRSMRYYDRNASAEQYDKNTRRWKMTYRLSALLGVFLILATIA